MKRFFFFAGALAIILFSTATYAATPPEQAAASLAKRIMGRAGSAIRFEQIPADAGKDVFELESRDGKTVIRGNSALSMAVGLNWYLKYYCHCSVSLNGSQMNLPKPLPVVPEKFRMSAWAASRYFFNYCTFSYSMSWWDWAQWERHIDWMALNGINQPLAVTGQEAVWQAVCRRFGVADADIEAFLAGPPYLPFGWMGCLDGWGGPLPKSWIPRHVELGKNILARERELGMTPILQGFTGHTPEALLKKFPGTKAHSIRWIEFDTWMLDPVDPLFQKIGQAWIEEQTKLFGTDHYYAADSFIEMTPPSGDLNYLTNAGRAIFQSMADADPKAVWLLQGWTFINQHRFWDTERTNNTNQERIKAFLTSVPDDRMIVLDLFCEHRPVWKKTEGFYGKPWVWSFICNFGNNTILGASGKLERFRDLPSVRNDPLGQNVRGVGFMMEGFSHNPLLYELMFELAWRGDIDLPLTPGRHAFHPRPRLTSEKMRTRWNASLPEERGGLQSWVRDYTHFRYGKANADAEKAWEILRTKIYSSGAATWGPAKIAISFPVKQKKKMQYPVDALADAWGSLLAAHKELGGVETYRHDLVNVARETLVNHATSLYDKVSAAYEAKDAAAYRRASKEFLELLHDLDELLATSDQFLLGQWLEDAKRWGKTPAERAQLEWNARRILTLWGKGEKLRDYAWKEWSGLIDGFYAKRWEIFFQRQQEALESGKPFDADACGAELFKFEDDWTKQSDRYRAKARGDSVAVAQRLFEKYGGAMKQ